MHYSGSLLPASFEALELSKCKEHTQKDIESFRETQKGYFQLIAVTGAIVIILYLLNLVNK